MPDPPGHSGRSRNATASRSLIPAGRWLEPDLGQPRSSRTRIAVRRLDLPPWAISRPVPDAAERRPATARHTGINLIRQGRRAASGGHRPSRPASAARDGAGEGGDRASQRAHPEVRERGAQGANARPRRPVLTSAARDVTATNQVGKPTVVCLRIQPVMSSGVRICRNPSYESTISTSSPRSSRPSSTERTASGFELILTRR